MGFPKRTCLRDWINEDLPEDEKPCVTGNALVRCTEKQKEQAVIQLSAGEGSAKEIAVELGVAESSIRRWRKSLLGEEPSVTMPKKHKLSDETIEEIITERDPLLQQREQLEKGICRKRLEYCSRLGV